MQTDRCSLDDEHCTSPFLSLQAAVDFLAEKQDKVNDNTINHGISYTSES